MPLFRGWLGFLAISFLCLATTGLAHAADAASDANAAAALDADIYKPTIAAFAMLFALAVILENALALIFNWRVFLSRFSQRGIRTPIMLGFALIIVYTFKIDVVGTLIENYKAQGDPEKFTPSFPSMLITAMVLAGGSAGVHRIMIALGFRTKQTEEELNPKPAKDKGWLAIRLLRDKAVGPVEVEIQPVDNPASPEQAAIAGVITRVPSVWSLLMRNPDSFPQNGGYELDKDKIYSLRVVGKDANGHPIIGLERQIKLAAGAIVDLDVKI